MGHSCWSYTHGLAQRRGHLWRFPGHLPRWEHTAGRCRRRVWGHCNGCYYSISGGCLFGSGRLVVGVDVVVMVVLVVVVVVCVFDFVVVLVFVVALEDSSSPKCIPHVFKA